MSSTQDDLKTEFAYLRDTVIDAIRAQRVTAVRDGLDTYERLLTTFVNALAALGVPYSREAALAEVNSIGGGWAEIDWIRDHYRAIADAAIGAESSEIIEWTFYFPTAVAGHAFRAREYYTFHQFIRWMPYLYTQALRIQQEPARNIAIDRCWRYLRELARFAIAPSLDQAEHGEVIRSIGDFALAVVATVGDLLKSALDRTAREDFGRFAHVLRGLFVDEYARFRYEIPSLEARLEERGLGEGEEIELKRRLERETALQNLAERIAERKRLIFLGLEAWVLHQYGAGKLNAEQAREWRASIERPGDMEANWRLLHTAIDHQTELDLGWHWWELAERDDLDERAFTSAGFAPLVERVFVIRALEALAAGAGGPLSLTAEAAYLAAPGGPLEAELDAVVGAADQWRSVVGGALDYAQPLRQMFTDVAEAQRREEARSVIAAQLSPARITEVRQHVLEGWRDAAETRRIVQAHGRYTSGLPEPSSDGGIGINLFDRKDVYVEHPRISAPMWGLEFGRNLARGEDLRVFMRLAEDLESSIPRSQEPHAVTEAIDDALARLRRAGLDPVILVVQSWLAENAITASEHFDPRSAEVGVSPSIGRYRQARLFRLRNGSEPSVFVVDIGRVGEWRQYIPEPFLESDTYLGDNREVLFSVRPLTREDAHAYFHDHPDALIREGEVRSLEEATEQLLQSVQLRVVEHFEFQIADATAGAHIRLGGVI